MKKRGQSAMEFLMTYGWAIIVVIVILSALYFLGVFNPKTPSTCNIQAPFVCNDFIATDMGVTYSVGAKSVSSATVTDIIINGQSCINNLNGTIINGNLAPNQITKVSCNGINLNAKQKVSAEIIIDYTGKAGDLTHTIKGSGSGITEFATFSIFYDGLVFGWNGSHKDDYIGGATGTLGGGLIPGNNQSGFFDNNATSFDGVNDYIEMSALVISDTELTMSAWVKIKGQGIDGYQGIVTNHDHVAPMYGLNMMILGTTQFGIASANGTTGRPSYTWTPNINMYNWNHYLITYKNGTYTAYFNGIPHSTTWNALLAQNPTPAKIRIGIWAITYGSYLSNGTIDEVAIWNRALSSGEIQNLYNYYQ